MVAVDTHVTMSEARYNDLVYLLLKKLFFEQCDMIKSPRECDIRVCMQMGCPALLTGLKDAILLPNEVSGRSHTKMVYICYKEVFDECLEYLESHWMKMTFEEASGDELVKQKMWDWCNEKGPNDKNLFEAILSVPEEECAITLSVEKSDAVDH